MKVRTFNQYHLTDLGNDKKVEGVLNRVGVLTPINYLTDTLNPATQQPLYDIEKISLAEDNSFMIYKNRMYPLEYIDTVYFGNPLGLTSPIEENKVKLAGRDVTKQIIYRTEFKDFVITFVYEFEIKKFRFDNIRFQNRTFRM
jgi:hypothetical protein